MPSSSRFVGSRSAGLPRVAIIGGGVIGLSIGWRLASRGCAVSIFDKGALGREASWAAAGMLAAQIETEPTEEALLPLTSASQNLWPGFAAELEAASGIDLDYRTDGTLVIALTRDDGEKLRFNFELHQRLGLDVRWLSVREALALEPCLNPRLAGAVFSPVDGLVDNRRVVTALIEACRRSGCDLQGNTSVAAVDIEAGAIRGVHAETEAGSETFFAADVVVLAAGAWSRGIPGLPEALRPPVRPVKGQMLALQMDVAQPLLRHVLWAPNAYFAPRRDGRLVIGATTEEKGFDTTMTAGGLLALLDGAWRALPGIEELPIIESWAGLRPGSRDDSPILGSCGVEGLIMATGHHRNGILLTPVTANAISDLILNGAAPDIIRPFALDRFVKGPLR